MDLLNEKILEFTKENHKDWYFIVTGDGTILQSTFFVNTAEGYDYLEGTNCLELCKNTNERELLKKHLANITPFKELPLNLHFPQYASMLYYVTGKPFYSEKGDLLFFLYLRSMEYYERTESYLNAIMQLHDGYVTIFNSTNYNLIAANDSYIRYMKQLLNIEYYPGIPFEKTISEENLPFWREKFDECCHTGYCHFTYKNPLEQSLDVTMIKDLQDEHSDFFLFSKNITKEEAYRNELLQINKTLEQKVTERTAKLEESYNNMRLFNQIITHEMKTPIREIEAYTGFLMEDTKDILSDESKDDLLSISNICKEVINCINEFVIFSKASYATTTPVRIDMKELFYSVIEDLTVLAKGYSISYKIHDLPNIVGDYLMMKQVLQNIIHNSIKFSKPDHINQITIGYMQNETAITYYINDHGVGFDSENEQNVFDIFKRAHNSKCFEGSGIGLSTVQVIVKNHGGRSAILSAKNKGCTVFLEFPISILSKEE